MVGLPLNSKCAGLGKGVRLMGGEQDAVGATWHIPPCP